MFAGANRECICLFMLLVLSALVFACHGLMYRRTITNTRRLLALRMTVQYADLLPDDTGASLFFRAYLLPFLLWKHACLCSGMWFRRVSVTVFIWVRIKSECSTSKASVVR